MKALEYWSWACGLVMEGCSRDAVHGLINQEALARYVISDIGAKRNENNNTVVRPRDLGGHVPLGSSNGLVGK